LRAGESHNVRVACALILSGALAACAHTAPAASASGRDSPRAHARASAPSASVELWAARLLAQINERRHSQELEPLAPDGALTEVAQRAAEECRDAAACDERELVARAHAALEPQALAYHRIGNVLAIVPELTEAAALDAVLASDPRQIGIGTAMRRATAGEAQAIAVVFALGTPRN
jgi:hypothetical protein